MKIWMLSVDHVSPQRVASLVAAMRVGGALSHLPNLAKENAMRHDDLLSDLRNHNVQGACAMPQFDGTWYVLARRGAIIGTGKGYSIDEALEEACDNVMLGVDRDRMTAAMRRAAYQLYMDVVDSVTIEPLPPAGEALAPSV
jgi:hypothetical protein